MVFIIIETSAVPKVRPPSVIILYQEDICPLPSKHVCVCKYHQMLCCIGLVRIVIQYITSRTNNHRDRFIILPLMVQSMIYYMYIYRMDKTLPISSL